MEIWEWKYGSDIRLTGAIFVWPMIAAKTHFLVRSLKDVRFGKVAGKMGRE
jgi:hypothetical protein